MRRCEHGVYWPDGQDKAYCCTLCNPYGNDGHPTPILPANGLALSTKATDALTHCGTCGNVRTFSSKSCRVCLTPFPETDETFRRQYTANAKQPGVCPKCSCAVHYVSTKPKTWICADCDTEYPAAKRITDESEI